MTTNPPRPVDPAPARIPATLTQPGAIHFWLAALLTGIGAGVSAAVLTRLLAFVQHRMWPESGASLLDAASQAGPWRHVLVLLAAGVLTGLGQMVLVRLTSGNGIDITQAIWFSAGRLPPLRTLGSALLSIVVVGMGASLGREGAPKQAAAVLANVLSDRAALPDEQRRLLVACGAGAGMAAAYGVPLGGALFALEVMRGVLALRMVLPALLTSLVAAAVSWAVLPDAPLYRIPAFVDSPSVAVWALLAGPIAGVASIGYVRAIAWADRNKPTGWQRFIAPMGVLGTIGVVSIWFPEILGNGREIAQLAFDGSVAPALVCVLLVLKPAATVMCMRSGTPGGLFTPSLSAGALLGALLGYLWSFVWPGVPPGLFALIGAGAVLAATTQGPISSVILMMELTGRDRSFVVPLLLAVVGATVVARTIEQRSIYEARLTDAQIAERHELRERSPTSF
jgi:CIC family chloride channel protein